MRVLSKGCTTREGVFYGRGSCERLWSICSAESIGMFTCGIIVCACEDCPTLAVRMTSWRAAAVKHKQEIQM